MSASPHLAVPVLHVTDLNAAFAFYTGVLGFSEKFRFEGRYGGVVAGKVDLHLSQGGGMFHRPIGGTNVYFMLDSTADVDAYYAEIVARGARVEGEPRDYPYGMRDFVAFDPDGNVLTFGAETGS